jgi:ribosomal-protein-alanine N-acetyltransferase
MIHLAPIDACHLPEIQAYCANPKLGRYSMIPSPYPDDGAQKWFDCMRGKMDAGSAKIFAIMRGNVFCGVMSIIDINHHDQSAVLGYWVAVPYQGQGIASNAAKLAIAEAKTRLGIRTLHGACLDVNHASSHVLEKIGFSETGRHLLHEGKHIGCVLRRYALVL